jgi:putative N6-adenine-specific DNA methylase
VSPRSYVSRAGHKLEAALLHFGLAARLEGAVAIDVGASTGGFTDCMLQHGAKRVVAIDVGHDQLHTQLRGDPRVELHERVHFKLAKLSLCPGPFDFFTVDVSFAAARTMLRPLAFRLRPGAEGVVLVKPQFELPKSAVRGGQVREDALRRRALDNVAERARGLGFTLVGAIDSPVPGGEGTVEILAHLRFEGRGPRLPAAPGAPDEEAGDEEKPAAPAQERAREPRAEPKAAAGPRLPSLALFAVASPGVEPALAVELAELGSGDADGAARDVRAVEGGVELEGDLDTCVRAHLELRTATRLLARVGERQARDFARLVAEVRTLPWERWLRAVPGRLHVSAHHCRLYHTGAVEERVRLGIGERLERHARPAAGAPASQPDQLPAPEAFVRGVDDRWTFSVDASGELLHRRGYREETARAPLRETLAAAVLRLAGWQPDQSLVDPMCGSGTLAIEAALRALRVAPGMVTPRRFAFEAWPLFAAGGGPARLEARRQQLVGLRRPGLLPGQRIVAADRHPGAVQATLGNAGRAGVAEHLTVVQSELASLALPEGITPGLVVVNPPYGQRLGGEGRAGRPAELRSRFRDLGEQLARAFGGWRAAVLVPREDLTARWPGRPLAAHPLSNGGIRVTLVVVALPPA